MNFFTVTPSANATLAGGNVTAKKDVSLFNKPPLQSSGKMTDTAKNGKTVSVIYLVFSSLSHTSF